MEWRGGALRSDPKSELSGNPTSGDRLGQGVVEGREWNKKAP